MNKQERLKIAKPILFSTEMVQAILEGRKIVIRRAIKFDLGLADTDKNDSSYLMIPDTDGDYHHAKDYCRYRVGDYLYVRETFCEVPYEYEHIPIKDGHITVPKIAYKADSETDYTGIWKPSIHMPKDLARIFLKVIDVRVERLQDITQEQALKEGLTGLRCGCNVNAYACTDCLNSGWLERPQLDFIHLWNSMIKKSDADRYGWEANPFVWVIEFERVEVKK